MIMSFLGEERSERKDWPLLTEVKSGCRLIHCVQAGRNLVTFRRGQQNVQKELLKYASSSLDERNWQQEQLSVAHVCSFLLYNCDSIHQNCNTMYYLASSFFFQFSLFSLKREVGWSAQTQRRSLVCFNWIWWKPSALWPVARILATIQTSNFISEGTWCLTSCLSTSFCLYT